MLYREFATPVPASGPLDTAAEVAKMMALMAFGQVTQTSWPTLAPPGPLTNNLVILYICMGVSNHGVKMSFLEAAERFGGLRTPNDITPRDITPK